MSKPLILILYDVHSLFTDSVRQHLNTIGKSKNYTAHYAAATDNAFPYFNSNDYDAIVVHYSVRVALGWHLSPKIYAQLAQYNGVVVLFVQDEYDFTEETRKFIESYKVKLVYTCVPDNYIEQIYPSARFPHTKFVHTLVGFTLPNEEDPRDQWSSIEERPLYIGYRGRKLPPVYGSLAREKFLIGQGMKQICLDKGVPCDIEWDEGKRIYGADWYNFIRSSRASLGTESGTNVFDFDGSIRKSIEQFLLEKPDAGFDEIYHSCVAEHDDFIQMNQISPRLFESIMLGTVLILFEGWYSGILKPGEHYIALKKDFSNVNEVLDTLDNVEKLEKMRNQAYKEVIHSERYSFAKFRDQFEIQILNLLKVDTKKIALYPLQIVDLDMLLPRPTQGRLHSYATIHPISVSDNQLFENTESSETLAQPSIAQQAEPDKNGIPLPGYPMPIRKIVKLFPWEFRQNIKRLLGIG